MMGGWLLLAGTLLWAAGTLKISSGTVLLLSSYPDLPSILCVQELKMQDPELQGYLSPEYRKVGTGVVEYLRIQHHIM